jgi:hypothetical protein
MVVQKESAMYDDSAVSFVWSASLVERLNHHLREGLELAERFGFPAAISIVLE